MANKSDIEANYSMVDKIFRYSIGETADFTNALWREDYTQSLESAQMKKHEYIMEQLHICKESKVLDMGCGWGPFLVHLKQAGAEGIGVTLSDAQVRSCLNNNLNVHMKDLRNITVSDFGLFDSIVCVGAMEHLCSIQEWEEGKQETIYKKFFQTVSNLLHKKGRFYLQTMTFGKNVIPYSSFDIDSPKDTDAYILALMELAQPGSWLPDDEQQVIRCSKPYFKIINKLNGRLEYIETIKHWKRRMRKFSFKKYLVFLSMVPRYFYEKSFRCQLNILLEDPNRKCFERQLMDHYRFVFEKQ